MNKRNAWSWNVLKLALGLLLAGCGSAATVGELRTESQSIEGGDAQPVHAQINLGAGDLKVRGGAEKLLEANFIYNVALLKPEANYTNGTLVVRHPDTNGLPALPGITGFRNEWDLRLNNETPIDLRVDMGAGSSDLQLADLSLTGLDVRLGAGNSMVDLSGNWKRDLDVTVDAGAANITLRLPKDAGVRVQVKAGVGRIDAPGLAHSGDVYTNAAYGMSDVTLRVGIQAGVGQVDLIEEEAAR